MLDSDLDQFGQMLDAVCSLLSRGTYQPSPTNTALWFRALSAHSIEDVRAAFDAHVKDPERGRFVPTPADILRQIHGDESNQALIAWGQALECVRSGRYSLDGPARAAVMSLGGWSVIGRSDETQNGFLQRQFVEAFKAYRAREIEEREALPFAEVVRLAGATNRIA